MALMLFALIYRHPGTGWFSVMSVFEEGEGGQFEASACAGCLRGVLGLCLGGPGVGASLWESQPLAGRFSVCWTPLPRKKKAALLPSNKHPHQALAYPENEHNTTTRGLKKRVSKSHALALPLQGQGGRARLCVL